MKKLTLLLLLLSCSILTFAQNARLQIIHNSPTPTVDIWVNGTKFLDSLEFRSATAFVDVPAGVNLNIGVAPSPSADTSEIIADFDVQLVDGGTYVVMATGIVGDVNTGFNLVVLDDARETALNANDVDIVVYHGATDAPSVDVVARGVGTLVDSLSYGEFNDYFGVPAGDYILDIVLASNPSIIAASYDAALTGLEGGAGVVFASGFLSPPTMGDPNFGLFVALANGDVIELPATNAEASLQIIHNSPSPTVDLWVNGQKFLDSLGYRTATPFVNVPAGTTLDIGVAPSPSSDPSQIIASFELILSPDENYVAIATGIVGDMNTPFDIVVVENARQRSNDPANVDFIVYHGATDAPTIDAIARDVAILADDLSYGEFTDYLEVPAANYIVDIVDPIDNDNIIVSYSAPLTSGVGSAAVVFASGFLNPGMGQPDFGLFVALPNGIVIPLPAIDNTARLQVLHNSPSPVVDVWLNGAKLLDSFAYRTATPFIDAPAGTNLEIGIAVWPSADTSDIIARFNVNLTPSEKYIAIANGIVGNMATPFNLVVIDDAREEASTPDDFALNVFHGAPDAPAVDIDVRNVAPGPQGLSFGEFVDYFEVPAADYILDINATGDPTILFSYDAPLTGLAGGAGLVFASGFLADTTQSDDFGLFLLLPNSDIVPLQLETVSTFGQTEFGLEIFPSLTDGIPVQLRWDRAQSETAEITIVSKQGALIQSQKAFGGTHEINQIDALTAGTYQVIFRSGNRYQTKSFVVQ